MATSSQSRRPGVTAIHSLNRFVFTVPDLTIAHDFYTAFGLNARHEGQRLDLYTHGHPHIWGSIYANGRPKRLQYLSFGIYEDDLESFRARIKNEGIFADPHPLSDGKGLWVRSPEGMLCQLVVSEKVTPSIKTPPTAVSPPRPGIGAAPMRRNAPPVYPRRLSHIALFSAEVPTMVDFFTRILGLKISDNSGTVVTFLHGAHGSDHHLIAIAQSEGSGLHHSSWDVGSIEEVGLGAELMKHRGYSKGWGLGRHVIGSNYFHYVQDPWGSWAEYSFDIDFIPANVDWTAADFPPEDSFYVWGPQVPDDFVVNYEGAAG